MIARIKAMDRRIAVALLIAAVAAVAGPFRLAVGFHSHPVGQHSHPMTVPYVSLYKYADDWVSTSRAINGYTITASNYSPIAGVLTEIIDTLPEGFEYLPGSTSGRITDDPIIDGRKLRWKKRIEVRGYTSLLRFEVRVASKPGRYHNVVDAKIKQPGIVNGTGATAQILVGAPTELFAQAALIKDGTLRVKFSARLTTKGRPLAAKWIDFRTDVPTGGCQAMTNADGVAECTGVLEMASAAASLGYEAEFYPDWWSYDIYAPASDHGDLIE
ncbi:MAG TPA: hypothetical protein VGB64_10980 [Actinomycetota bacterium]